MEALLEKWPDGWPAGLMQSESMMASTYIWLIGWTSV